MSETREPVVTSRATPSCPPQRDHTGVVWKNVTSANPDKSRIQARLRRAAGVAGGKVTLVKISKDGRLVKGHVMTPTMATTPAGTRHRSNVSHGIICCDHPDHTHPDQE